MDQPKRMGDFTCDLVQISIFAMKYYDPKQLGEENVFWLTLHTVHHERKTGQEFQQEGFESGADSEAVDGC